MNFGAQVEIKNYADLKERGFIQEVEGDSFDSFMYGQTQCVICFSAFNENHEDGDREGDRDGRDGDSSCDLLSKLNCGHVFHKDCLKSWIDTGRAKTQFCIVCNKKIESEPEVLGAIELQEQQEEEGEGEEIRERQPRRNEAVSPNETQAYLNVESDGNDSEEAETQDDGGKKIST